MNGMCVVRAYVMQELRVLCGLPLQLSQSMVFLELLLMYYMLTGLPWSIYSTFVLEECHNFNKQVRRSRVTTVASTTVCVVLQTPAFFAKDHVKSLVLQMTLIPPIFLGLLYTIQAGGRAFFIYAWLFVAAVTFVSATWACKLHHQ